MEGTLKEHLSLRMISPNSVDEPMLTSGYPPGRYQ